ncbi:MAG: PsiF family protein [Casimicrobiaceae bacterium]
MKKLMLLIAASAMLATAPALAQNTQQDKMKACNASAADKKGDERKAFMKTCLSAKPATAAKPESKMAMCNKKTAGMAKDERSKAQSECMKAA